MEFSITELQDILKLSKRGVYHRLESRKLEDKSSDALMAMIAEESAVRARKELIKELKAAGWIRKKRWPSKRDIETDLNPWL